MKYKGYKSIMAVGVALSLLAGVSVAEAAKVIKYSSKNTVVSTAPKIIKIAQKGKTKSTPKSNQQATAKQSSMLVEKDGKSYFLGTELPADYKKISIFGEAEATKKQAVAYIKQANPKVRLDCSVEELVDLYWQEAEREEVRPDLALAQSLVEGRTLAPGITVIIRQTHGSAWPLTERHRAVADLVSM